MVAKRTKTIRPKNAGIESAVIEIRYPNAYLIWDRAGRIWDELIRVFPSLELVEAEPRKTHFKLDNQYELAVQLDMSYVKSFSPKSNLSNFLDVVDKFFASVLKQLEVDECTRIGFRIIWSVEHSSIGAASDSVLGLQLLNVPDHKFGIENSAIDRPDIRIRWESERLGTHMQVRAEKRQINVSPPLNLAKIMPPIEKESCVAIYDVDYYTMASITIGQLNLRNWISQAFQTIKKESQDHLSKLGA